METLDERKRRIRASRAYRTELAPAIERARRERGLEEIQTQENWKFIRATIIGALVLVGLISWMLAPFIVQAFGSIPW